MRKISAVALLLVAATVAATAAGGELALMNNGVACPIGVQAETAPFGAALAAYLTQMSGKEFRATLLKDGRVPEGPAVLVLTADDKTPKLGGDSFTIKTEGDKLRLVGETPIAAGFAVFAFLEQALGCRWWSLNEEEVPENTTLRIKPLDMAVKAPFRQTDLYNREAQSSENHFRLKSRAVSTEQFSAGHSLYPLLKEHAAAHPEIFPMNKDGKRAGNDLHFCYLAPGIVDALSDALEKVIVKKKGNVKDWIYFAGMGDWYGGMCQCKECKKVYEEETWTAPDEKQHAGYSATLLRMMNAVGEKLEQKCPGVRVGTFAYMSIDAPPAKTRPRANVVIWMPHLRYCVAHPLGRCEKNRQFLQKLERWCQIAPGNVYIWDYATDFDNFLYPFPVIRSLAANIKIYARLGCAGVLLQGNYVSTGGDLAVLKNYVWHKLLWNPGLDADGLINEFCDGYYGPAAAAMKRYVFLLEDAAAKGKDFDEFSNADTLKKVLLTLDMQRAMREALDAALKDAGKQEPYRRRVKEAGVGLDAFELIGNAPQPRILAPKDGYLAVNGVVTWPRAEEMLRNCRNASFREWGGFLAYHEGFLRSHGGPLVQLKRDGVEIEVAPAQAGRIYQIRFNGKPLLRSQYLSEDKKDAKSPTMFRGSFEKLTSTLSGGKPACYALLHEKQRQAERIVMDGNADVGLWHQTANRIEKTVELKDRGTVRTAGKTAPIKGKGAVAEQAITVTDYMIVDGKGFTIETSPDGAAWRKMETGAFAGADTGQPLRCDVAGPVKALRIGLPGSDAVVRDCYLSPNVEKVELMWDKAHGVLTTEVTTARDAAGNWPEREITFSSSR